MAGRGVDIILGGPKDKVDKKVWQKEHDEVIKLGGLCVVGTERHESRRIDNQLRGRAGRQGDPGYSQFYVALDDDIMRIFGGEKISSLMSRFNMPEDTPLTHPLVSRVIEQIQVKVEGFHFDARKSLVEYDDVINRQRQIVYKIRDEVLLNQKELPDKNDKLVFKYLTNQINNLVNINTSYDNGKVDLDKVILEFTEILPMNSEGRSNLKKDLSKSKDVEQFLEKILQDQWQARVKMFGKDITNSILAFSVVSSLDQLWVEHLTTLDNLRDSVRLRGYAQKDPLVEYRKEGFEMFQNLMGQFEYNLARKLYRIEPVAPQEVAPQNVTESRGASMENKPQETNNQPVNNNPSPNDEPDALPPHQQPIKKDNPPGRNDPCPCGSGKKYKKCCYPKFG
jgi:preprotein translocase subunit SecA